MRISDWSSDVCSSDLYAIDGDRAPWRPLHAFDDGRQVFIEFPKGIGQGELPPLFVVGSEGDTSELVNYRVRGNYVVVDRLFAAAELRFGSGKNQKRVRITRTDGRQASCSNLPLAPPRCRCLTKTTHRKLTLSAPQPPMSPSTPAPTPT